MQIHQFKTVAERNARERELRHQIADNILPFGVHYLDRVMRGILKTDLVLIGGKSGCGKTELAYTIADSVASIGKRVHLFCLEAEEGEYERRQKFRKIAKAYYASGGNHAINFYDWCLGDYDMLEPFEEAVQAEMNAQGNIHTFYRDAEFDLDAFSKVFCTLNGQSDLVVIDHLHYFDVPDDRNENKAFTDILKRIRDLSLIQQIPVILVAHLRKGAANAEEALVPDMTEFQGSSNIFKIVTKVITLGSGGLAENGNPITYFRIPKFRAAGERTKIIGKTEFDTKLNTYDTRFAFGVLSDDQQEFIPIKKPPHWLRV